MRGEKPTSKYYILWFHLIPFILNWQNYWDGGRINGCQGWGSSRERAKECDFYNHTYEVIIKDPCGHEFVPSLDWRSIHKTIPVIKLHKYQQMRTVETSEYHWITSMSKNGCTSLHSHQHYMRVPISPHPHQHLLLSVFLIIAILMMCSRISLWL